MLEAVDFISEIYVHGITESIVNKYKDSFNEFAIIIHEDDKFIQVNESVIRFNESVDSDMYGLFTTTKDFPDNDSLALLCDNYSEFCDFAVFEVSRVTGAGKILDDLKCRAILESILPREGIFYIYNDDLVVDVASTRKVYLSSGDCSKAKNVNPDNEMLHAAFWGKYMIPAYPELQDKNYLSIPRGRVMYKSNEFVIFLDKSYVHNHSIKSKIEKEFKLSRARGYHIKYVENPHYDYTRYK